MAVKKTIKKNRATKPPVISRPRMYGFVPYNISDKQKGIQFGHAVVEYSLKYGRTKQYKDFARYEKTFIILNGGTTNVRRASGMTNILNDLKYIKNATFYEPDLNDTLSAIVLLVDEKAWDKETYPCNAENIPGFKSVKFEDRIEWLKYKQTQQENTTGRLSNILVEYQHYLKTVGKDNAWLRYYLQKFQLA